MRNGRKSTYVRTQNKDLALPFSAGDGVKKLAPNLKQRELACFFDVTTLNLELSDTTLGWLLWCNTLFLDIFVAKLIIDHYQVLQHRDVGNQG